MDLNNEMVFNEEMSKLGLDKEDFDNFKEFFGSKCENPMPEELNLKQVFLLQSATKNMASKLEMDSFDVMEALTELCIGTYS